MVVVDVNTLCKPPSMQRISWFEKAYRVALPSEYKGFLKTHNGAVPLGTTTFALGRNERVIERFLPLLDSLHESGEAGWYDISVVVTQIADRLIADEDLVGTDVVPIAALFGGDFLCLDYRADPASPSIAVWDHEASDEGAPVFHYVCQSFRNLLELLRQDPP